MVSFSITSIAQKDEKEVIGFGILKHLPGLWNGPVTSTTPAGNFPNWYIDFRPVSPGEVSQFSLLDSMTVNNISFFVVKYNDQYRIAMHTLGCFAHQCCATYEVIDSVDEANGYYRFVDFVAGYKRAYTEFKFTDNSFVMEVYTSKFNKENPPVLHSVYKAKLADRSAAKEAIKLYNYPQPVSVKDFTAHFNNMTESIFFDINQDPYPPSEQPATGRITVKISVDPSLKTNEKDEMCIFLTTESLFEGLKYIPENLKYLSKYIYFPAGTKSITINNVHPGKYYLYSFNDRNGDKYHKSGDYMSSKLDNIVTVATEGTSNAETKIDLVIP